MAPVEEVYFPPLDRCLGGKHHLLSWEVVYFTLSQSRSGHVEHPVKSFLKDPRTTDLLCDFLSPYKPSTAATKSVFDAQISTAQTAPGRNPQYDAQQLQEDALWLCKTARIDEVSALRIVILELQNRPAATLLRGNSLDNSHGTTSQPGSFDAQSTGSVWRNSRATENPQGKDLRRLVLLQTFLLEDQYLLKTVGYLLSFLICDTATGPESKRRKKNDQRDTWLADIGLTIHSALIGDLQQTDKTSRQGFIDNLVDTLREGIDRLSQGCPWLVIEEVSDSIESDWATAQLLRLIHIEQIMFCLLQLPSGRIDSEQTITWFRLMREVSLFEELCNFLQELGQQYRLPLESLAVLISLVFLDVPSTLDLLKEASFSGVLSTDATNERPYILTPPIVNEMNNIMIDLTALKVASPLTLAWSIISQNIRELAAAAKESKETRQSVRAADRYGAVDLSEPDAAERAGNKEFPPLHRRSSVSSDNSLQLTLLEEIHDNISITEIDGDPITYLALSAVQNDNVFDVLATISSEFCTALVFEHAGILGARMRTTLLGVISTSIDYVPYQPALIDATVAILTGSKALWDVLDDDLVLSEVYPSSVFIRNPELRHSLLLRAASRFPYESLPLLQICRCLGFQFTNSTGEASKPWTNLEELDTFTCRLPGDFKATVPIREDEDKDYLQLVSNLKLYIGSKETDLLAQDAYHTKTTLESEFLIPSGTTGVLQSETKPFVVCWNFQYQGLAYIGKILETALKTTATSPVSLSAISPILVVEIISLLNTLLVSAIKDPSGEGVPSKALESVESILGQASDGLSSNQDIISIVLQLFENEVYRTQQILPDESSLGILAQCTQFMYIVLNLMPDRIWPFLGRSGLVGVGQDEPQFGYVLSQEVSIGRYEFLLGCIRLYTGLVEDTLSQAVSRRVPQKALVRFGSFEKSGSGISETCMRNVLLNLSRCMVDVFESVANWKFLVPADRAEVNFHLCNTFERILTFCFGVDDMHEPSEKLSHALAPSAKYLIDAFLSTSNNDFIVKPLLNILDAASCTQRSSLPTNRAGYFTRQAIATLDLCSALIRLNSFLQKPSTHLEAELFKSTALLTKVYARQLDFRLPVTRLLDSILCSAARDTQQPPSLLGFLGQSESSSFVDLLSKLDQPLHDPALSDAIWTLLKNIVNKRQQWFAMYVLTGSTPRESLKVQKENSCRSLGTDKTILMMALDSLSYIERLHPRESYAMLEFVVTAADYWPSVFTTLEAHPQFLKAMAAFDDRQTPADQGIAEFLDCQVASRVSRMLAMYCHHARQKSDDEFARSLVPRLVQLMPKATKAPSYNNSLHGNLRHNFRSKYLQCDVDEFKRTNLTTASPGDSFYFDMKVASKMLQYDPAWRGRRDQGFAEEFRRANMNLSLVDAEIELFLGWKSLLLELSEGLSTKPRFQRVMAQAAAECLRTNANNTLPQSVFERLLYSRADLAFTLTQRLVEVESTQAEAKEILKITWSTILKYNTNVDIALSGEEANYYRVLLRTLYLALRLHAPKARASLEGAEDSTSSSSALLQLIYEILSKEIAQGFRSLTLLLHSSPDRVQPSDFALLIAILRSCLQVPGLEKESSRLLVVFSNSQTAHCAATLLSWSDRLAASTSNDPIFGALAIEFLVEMSSETSLAESLAVDGVLTQILSTNVVRVLSSRPFGPLDRPNKMYSIWVRGLLPLMLNLLNAIGPPIAAEITSALNTFPHQLKQASNGLALTSSVGSKTGDRSQDYITLSAVSGLHSLALIVGIINAFREAGASAGVIAKDIDEVKWDSSQVAEDIEGWLQSRDKLRSRIIATDPKEEAWTRRKALNAGSLSESLLEEKIVHEMAAVVGILSTSDDG